MSRARENGGIISNVLWKLGETFLSQGVTFVVSIVLARLLSPDDYGAVTIMLVFTTIANVFVISGIPTALIQKKETDERDFSSVFFFNFGLSVILYLILFAFSPMIAAYYETPVLTKTLRVLGLSVIIAALNSVQSAYVSRNMLFKKYFFSTLSGSIVSGCIGIIMAYMGFGVWTLVVQYVAKELISAGVLWFTVKWRPIFYFSFVKIKSMLSFGWKILFEGLSDTLVGQLNNLLIGKVYTSADLGFYSKGQQFPGLIVTNFCASISAVLLPAISSEQDDIMRVKALLRKSVKVTIYVTFPMLTGLAVVAEPLIRLLMTEKWLGAVPFLRIYCLLYAVSVLLIPRHQALNGIGRSDVFMYEHMFARLVSLAILFFTYKISVMAIAIGSIGASAILLITIMFTSRRYNAYLYREQISDIIPVLLACLCMGVPVYFMNYINCHDLILLALQAASGVAIYIGMSTVFKLDGFDFILSYIKQCRGDRSN